MKKRILLIVLLILILTGIYVAFVILISTGQIDLIIGKVASKDINSVWLSIIPANIIFGCAILFMTIVLLNTISPKRKTTHLLKVGEKAKALVLSVETTGVTVNRVNLCLRLKIEVKPLNKSPFQVSFEQVFSIINIPRAGDEIEVLFNPNNLTEVALAPIRQK